MTQDVGKHWYIVHTYSGFENKVKESLEQRVAAYGLQEDIGEERNLAASQPERAKALAEKLARWRERIGAPMPTPNRQREP